MLATCSLAVTYPSTNKPGRVRRELTLEQLVRKAAASVDRGDVKLITGRFRPTIRGRPLTRREQGLLLLFAFGLSLAIWLHARPEPVSARTTHLRALALSTRLDTTTPRRFTQSALLAVGKNWRPATLFACLHPAFWDRTPAVHPNRLAQDFEDGLARLSRHGAALSALVFDTPSPFGWETIDGKTTVACRVTGQLELADGVVVRFSARLVQVDKTQHWGILDLSMPPFLP